jgi:hypothetical protein
MFKSAIVIAFQIAFNLELYQNFFFFFLIFFLILVYQNCGRTNQHDQFN